MSIRSRARLFHTKASMNYENNSLSLRVELRLLLSPYGTADAHGLSLLYPLQHAKQLVTDTVNLVYGVGVLVASLVTFNGESGIKVAKGLLSMTGAIISDVLNCVVSIVSLATRLLATIINLGYVESSVKPPDNDGLRGNEFSGSGARGMAFM